MPFYCYRTSKRWSLSKRASLGISVSVLAHVLAVALLWHARPALRDINDKAVSRIEVRLVSITPEVPIGIPPSLSNSALSTSTTVTRHPASNPARARPAPSIRVSSAPLNQDTALAPQPESGTGAAVSTFNIEAARAAARLIVREDEKSFAHLPQRQPGGELKADDHVANALERARRVDCQTARAGSANLLANVILLAKDMVANAIDDSGCKW